MKTSKIIFSMVFIAGALMSMTSNAQTRVTINAGIIAPYGYPPQNGYVYYAPQPTYPSCGIYYAPRGHYNQACGHQHHAHHNHPQHGYDCRHGNHNANRNANRNGNGNRNGNHPNHY